MKFQYVIADRQRTVEVHRQTSGFEVVVDGHSHLVDAVRVAGDTWSLVVRDDAAGKARARSVEVVVVPQSSTGSLDVHVDGYWIPVQPRAGHGRRTRDGSSASGAGTQRVLAPMPGKVLRVLVKPGDEVRTRQGLVVVEAMKMENELRAAREGRVREVLVAEGQSVEAGTALVVVE